MLPPSILLFRFPPTYLLTPLLPNRAKPILQTSLSRSIYPRWFALSHLQRLCLYRNSTPNYVV